MTFDYALLPHYDTRTIHPRITATEDDAFIKDKQIADNGVGFIEIQASQYTTALDQPCCVHNIARINLLGMPAKVHIVYTPIGLKHAVVEGTYTQDIENFLREQVQAVSVAVTKPAQESYKKIKADFGFIMRTPILRWYAPVLPFDEYLASLPHRGGKKFRSHLKKSEHVRVDCKPLTINFLDEWEPLYVKEFTERPGGTIISHIKILREGDSLDGLYGVMYYDDKTDEPLGGAIINTWGAFHDIGIKPRKFCTTQLQVNPSQYKHLSLSYRSHLLTHELSMKLGDKVIGHGGDLNFFGTDISPGLLGKKCAFGMRPYPEAAPELFKILNVQQLDGLHKVSGGYFFELLDDSPYLQHYFATGKPIAWSLDAINELVVDADFDASKHFVMRYIGKKRLITAPIGVPVKQH